MTHWARWLPTRYLQRIPARYTPIGSPQALKMVIEKDGISGLLFRGLVTKIISNGCQGILFSVLWRLGQDFLNKK